MNDSFDELQKHSMRTLLRDEERMAMRDSLLSYIQKTPISDESLYNKKTSGHGRWYLVTLAAVIVVLLGVVAAIFLSARTAEPGQFLYPLKVYIIDPLVVLAPR